MNLAFSVIAMEWFDKISEFMEGLPEWLQAHRGTATWSWLESCCCGLWGLSADGGGRTPVREAGKGISGWERWAKGVTVSGWG